jgi:hypothetical protein
MAIPHLIGWQTINAVLSFRDQPLDDRPGFFFDFAEVFCLCMVRRFPAVLPDAALGEALSSKARRLATHPIRLAWGTLAIAKESAGTFWVTVVPAAITAPSPIVTGATS